MESELGWSVKPLTHTSLREQAAVTLRALVTLGELVPGKIYPIGPIAARLNVSATPVREALLDMAKDGIVEVIRGRGLRVPVVSQQELNEIFQLRRELVEDFCMSAVESAPASELDAVLSTCRGLNARAKEAAEKQDFGSFSAADRELHLSLVALAHNRRLVELVGRLRDSTVVYGHDLQELSWYMSETTEQYDLLLTALSQRRFINAREIMRRHLDTVAEVWGRAVVRLTANTGDEGPP